MPELTFLAPPVSIGQIWPGQGGIYAGLVRGVDGKPDQHLILAEKQMDGSANWSACVEWANGIEAEGLADFTLPQRAEASILFANLKDRLKQRWHWLAEAEGSSYAWCCSFLNGYQSYDFRSFEGCAVAVRRFDAWILESLPEAA